MQRGPPYRKVGCVIKKKLIGKIDCGNNKWSVGVTENGEIEIIKYSYPPGGYLELSLTDASKDDLLKLASLFRRAAEQL